MTSARTDKQKTKAQLMAELRQLRARLDELEETSRESAAHELRESQRVARLGTYVFDAVTGLWTSSEILDQIFGIAGLDYTRDVEGWLRVVHPHDREEMATYLQDHVLGQGLEFDREYRIVRVEDGQTRWVHGRGELSWDDGGNVVRMLGTIHDITERKQVEEELRAALQWQDAIIEGSRDALFISDTESRFVRVNSAACELTGYSQEELLGMRIPDLHEEIDLAAYRTFHASIMAGEPALTEADLLRKDGGKVSVEFNNSRIEVAGEPFMHTVARDITEWKEAQSAIVASRQRIRSLAARMDSVREEERTVLARELHDEVGQALTAMRMDLSLIEQTERREHLTHRIHSMIDLTEDALQRVNRMSRELRSPILQILGLWAAVEAQVEDFREHAGVEVKLELREEELPPGPERDLATFRILQESLMNARRHARAEAVAVSMRVEEGDLVLEVSDDGIGVTEEQLNDHEAFGLIGMEERAQRLGGNLDIRPGAEGGTTVSARIPLAPPTEDQPPATS